jgi:heme-degrading monooxygenase HmoA
VAVLFRHHVTGMDAATYDQAASQLAPQLKEQPGFLYHAAFADSDGFTVSEIWESKEQHDRWFADSVTPNVPAEIAVEEVEIHNIVTP